MFLFSLSFGWNYFFQGNKRTESKSSSHIRKVMTTLTMARVWFSPPIWSASDDPALVSFLIPPFRPWNQDLWILRLRIAQFRSNQIFSQCPHHPDLTVRIYANIEPWNKSRILLRALCIFQFIIYAALLIFPFPTWYVPTQKEVPVVSTSHRGCSTCFTCAHALAAPRTHLLHLAAALICLHRTPSTALSLHVKMQFRTCSAGVWPYLNSAFLFCLPRSLVRVLSCFAIFLFVQVFHLLGLRCFLSFLVSIRSSRMPL